MTPTFQPVLERHDEYDAHFLRACIQGPMPDTIALQLKDQDHGYLNPWLVPWYLRPKCERTDLCLADFVEDFRVRFECVLAEVLPQHSSASSVGDVPRARTLLRYLSHTIVQHAVALHAQRFDVERMLTIIRRDLRVIFPKQLGQFIVESPAHPFWKDGIELRPNEEPPEGSGYIVKRAQRTPTAVEKKLALFLAGPTPNLEGPQGIIKELIERAQPHLLSLHTGKCMLYAIELRRRIFALLRGKSEFSSADRRKVIEWIADEWEKTRPPVSAEQLNQVDRWSGSVDEILAKNFGPEVIKDRTAFTQRQFLLEQMSIQSALEAEGGDTSSDIDRIFGVWKEATLHHRIALCDAPTLGLAFLAGNACYSDVENFSAHLGIDQ